MDLPPGNPSEHKPPRLKGEGAPTIKKHVPNPPGGILMKMKKLAAKSLASFVKTFREMAGRAEFIASARNPDCGLFETHDITEKGVEVRMCKILEDGGTSDDQYVVISFEEIFSANILETESPAEWAARQ